MRGYLSWSAESDYEFGEGGGLPDLKRRTWKMLSVCTECSATIPAWDGAQRRHDGWHDKMASYMEDIDRKILEADTLTGHLDFQVVNGEGRREEEDEKQEDRSDSDLPEEFQRSIDTLMSLIAQVVEHWLNEHLDVEGVK